MGDLSMRITASKKLYYYLILTISALLIVFPILFAVLLSFSNNRDIMNGIYIPGSISFANFENAMNAQPLLHYIFNSFIVASLEVVLTIILSLLAAYAFVFIKFKGRNFFFWLFMATMMIPMEVLIVSNFHTIRSFGMLNTYIGLILPGLASTFGIFLLRQNFKQIPFELKEANDIAGLGDFQFLRKIVIPMAKNAIFTLAIYNFLVSWNSYMWPLLSTTNETVRTVQIGLRQLKATEGVSDYGMITAAALIVALPTLFIIIFGQSRLQEGLAKGAIK